MPGSVRRMRLPVCDELFTAEEAAEWAASSAGVVCAFTVWAADISVVVYAHPRHVAVRARRFNRRLCVLVEVAVALGLSLLDPDAAAGYVARKPPAGEWGERDLAALLAGAGRFLCHGFSLFRCGGRKSDAGFGIALRNSGVDVGFAVLRFFIFLSILKTASSVNIRRAVFSIDRSYGCKIKFVSPSMDITTSSTVGNCLRVSAIWLRIAVTRQEPPMSSSKRGLKSALAILFSITSR